MRSALSMLLGREPVTVEAIREFTGTNRGHRLIAGQARDAEEAGNFQEAVMLWIKAADWIKDNPGQDGPCVPTCTNDADWLRIQRKCYLLLADKAEEAMR